MQQLITIGFKKVGSWELVEDRLVFSLDVKTSSANVLYVFISNETVLYIGKTTRTLSNRLMGYVHPGPTQLTNLKNNAHIKTLLQHTSLDIYALEDNGLLSYGPFRINLAAGLEDSLIDVFKPKWNGK